MNEQPPRAVRLRREPPSFREVEVRRVEQINARLARVTFGGPELAGMTVEQPAASVRLLLPPGGSRDLVMPAWNGNEFLLRDGTRPIIRTFTPLRVTKQALDVDIVRHGAGAASDWIGQAVPGDAAAISGPGRGYDIDADAPAFLLAGDETALPAIGQLLEHLPAVPAEVFVEVAVPDARVALPDHPLATVNWLEQQASARPGDAVTDAIRDASIPVGARVWVAGEAAAVQRVRRHLFDERGVARAHAHVRGYWKHGRTGGADSD
jgi:NADPH-dependent ferric siderophore reductase